MTPAASDIWKNHSDRTDALLCHGTAVALNGWACLLLGPSGCGKSGLALQLMAMGCGLVSDDRVWVQAEGAGLSVSAPSKIAGRIEARGVGILATPNIPTARLAFAVDMSQLSEDRCPPSQFTYIEDIAVRVIPHSATPYMAAALRHILEHGTDCLET